MKNLVFKIFGIILLVSCTSPTPLPEAIDTRTAKPSEIPQTISLPTSTQQIIPTQPIVPISPVPIEHHPQALNEFNAGTEMKLLNTIGTGNPHDIQFSPDGSLLAIATGRGVYLYDSNTFEQTGFIDANDSVSAVAFNPSGEKIALAIDGKTSIWNVNSGKMLIELEDEMVYVYKISYGSGGYVAAIGGDCQDCGTSIEAMILWDEKDGKKIYEERNIWYGTRALDFTYDGKTLFFGGKDGLIRLDIESREETTYSRSKSLIESSVDVPYDIILDEISKKAYVISSYDNLTEIINLETKTVIAFNLCQTGYKLLIQSKDTGICNTTGGFVFFDLRTGDKIDTIASAYNTEDVTINAKGDKFVYFNDYGFEVVELPNKKLLTKIPLNNFNYAKTGLIKLNGQKIYVAAILNYSGEIDIVNIQTGSLIQNLKVECCKLKGFAFAPNQKTAVTVQENKISFWDLEKQKVTHEINTNDNLTGAITFSPNAQKIFLIDQENSVLEIELRTEVITKFNGNTYSYGYGEPFAEDNFIFNPRDDLILLHYQRNNDTFTPLFVNIATNETMILPYAFRSELDALETFASNFDNKYMATGNVEGIFIWETQNANLLFKLDKHEWRGGDGWIGSIKHLLFSPRSNLLLSVGWDETTRLWNTTAGTELRRLNVCCSVSFTPDGRYLVTAGDGVIRIWGIP